MADDIIVFCDNDDVTKWMGVTVGISNTFETHVNRNFVIAAPNKPACLLRVEELLKKLTGFKSADEYVAFVNKHTVDYDRLFLEWKERKQLKKDLNSARKVLQKQLDAKWETKKDLIRFRIRNCR